MLRGWRLRCEPRNARQQKQTPRERYKYLGAVSRAHARGV